MESLTIKSVSGDGRIEFFDRVPFDSGLPLEKFWIRITDLNFSAAAEIDGKYTNFHPLKLFTDMAERWRGWAGEQQWLSIENNLHLRCTQDPTGNVSIRIALNSGPMGWDWSASATVVSEAGQLDAIARRAVAFFGNPR